MYLGYCFYSGMVRPTDQKMITIEKTVCDMVPKKGMPTTQATWGRTGVSQEAEGVRKAWAKERNEQDKEADKTG